MTSSEGRFRFFFGIAILKVFYSGKIVPDSDKATGEFLGFNIRAVS